MPTLLRRPGGELLLCAVDVAQQEAKLERKHIPHNVQHKDDDETNGVRLGGIVEVLRIVLLPRG